MVSRLSKPDAVCVHAEKLICRGKLTYGKMKSNSFLVSFNHCFGATPCVAVILWNMLIDFSLIPEGARIFHLLWAMMFLKLYACEVDNAARAEVDAKTYRKWTWKMVKALGKLMVKVVSKF